MTTDPCDPLRSERELLRRLLSAETLGCAKGAPNAAYTPLVVLWLMVFQRLEAGPSLSDAISELLARFPRSARGPRAGTLSANTGACSRARSHLPAEAAREAADAVAAALTAPLPPCWLGRRCYLLGGTTCQLGPTPALRRAYPPARNQSGDSH